MATKLIRYLPLTAPDNLAPQWGVVFDKRVAPVPGTYATTRQLMSDGLDAALALTPADATEPLDRLRVLSPITGNQQFLCQGINYASHVRESGIELKNIPFNTLFIKASSSLCGPSDDIVRPKHVRLLDYEIELGLVLRRDLRPSEKIGADQLHEVLAGVTIINDISARDVQLPQVQFYKGKSYRSFGPAGPYLLLLNRQEWARWPELHMQLQVNDKTRQDAYCGEMLHKPHQTLSELSGLQDVLAGDVIATGTPAGCALKAPKPLVAWVAKHLLSDTRKWRMFIEKSRANPLFLQPGDQLKLSIRTDDGQLDLGTQNNRVVGE